MTLHESETINDTPKAKKRASLFQMMRLEQPKQKRTIHKFGVPDLVADRPENAIQFYIMAQIGTNKIKCGKGQGYKARLEDMKVLGVMWASINDVRQFKIRMQKWCTKKNVKHPAQFGDTFETDGEIRDYLREWLQQPYVARGGKGIDKLPFVANGDCWLPPRGRNQTIGFFNIPKVHDGSWSEFLVEDKPGEDSYYSPDLYTAGAREVMGAIDLDPASCKEANWGDGIHQGVQARKFYDIKQDGLRWKWYGRVFINPPFGEWKHWARKAERELKSGRVTELCIFLGTTTITNSGFARLKKLAQAVYIPDGRKHGNTWGPKSILTSAYQGHCLFYWGDNAEKFREVFSHHGSVFLGMSADETWRKLNSKS